MRTYNQIACLALLFAASTPARSAAFSGPGLALDVTLYQYSALHNWDLSNLSLVDTPDGMRLSGSMSANITNPAGAGQLSGVILNAYRPLGQGTGLDFTLTGQQTGSLSITGSIAVTQVASSIGIPYSNCGSSLFVGVSASPPSGLSSGSIAGGPFSTTCEADILTPTTNFIISTSVYYIPNGSGTITVDFGNSVLGEVRLAGDTSVPEPSSLWLLSAILPVLLIRRRA